MVFRMECVISVETWQPAHRSLGEGEPCLYKINTYKISEKIIISAANFTGRRLGKDIELRGS